jgi:hypothetical protein
MSSLTPPHLLIFAEFVNLYRGLPGKGPVKYREVGNVDKFGKQ